MGRLDWMTRERKRWKNKKKKQQSVQSAKRRRQQPRRRWAHRGQTSCWVCWRSGQQSQHLSTFKEVKRKKKKKKNHTKTWWGKHLESTVTQRHLFAWGMTVRAVHGLLSVSVARPPRGRMLRRHRCGQTDTEDQASTCLWPVAVVS